MHTRFKQEIPSLTVQTITTAAKTIRQSTLYGHFPEFYGVGYYGETQARKTPWNYTLISVKTVTKKKSGSYGLIMDNVPFFPTNLLGIP